MNINCKIETAWEMVSVGVEITLIYADFCGSSVTT